MRKFMELNHVKITALTLKLGMEELTDTDCLLSVEQVGTG